MKSSHVFLQNFFGGEQDFEAQNICIATSLAPQKDKILLPIATLYFSLKGCVLTLAHKAALHFPPTINHGLANRMLGIALAMT